MNRFMQDFVCGSGVMQAANLGAPAREAILGRGGGLGFPVWERGVKIHLNIRPLSKYDQGASNAD